MNYDHSTIQDLETVIDAGIDAAQSVVDNWKSGDLAGAVNSLEDWATKAADYLPDAEQLEAQHREQFPHTFANES